MISIANPIYDSVFKYLMQDTRVAKVMIENLLGYKVGDVTIKNNENCVYKVVERIDEKTGRKYLQTKEYPYPIIQVYLLGHKLQEIESAISKSQLKFIDLDNNEVKGVDDCLFVKSLTHQTIIVQIPRLPQKTNHRLEEIMSVLNYKAILDREGHIVKIEDSTGKSEEYQLIVRRLQEAVADEKVRKQMEEEDDLKREYDLWMQNQKFREDAAKAEGIAVGRAEGRAEGIEEGLEKGRAEAEAKAHEEKLEMARKMKADGMSIEMVAGYSGLLVDEVRNL